MRRITFVFSVLVAVCLASSSIAHAQATRTWVSGVGDDANPCSRTAPCKTWAGAISKTAPGGEISALDPGGFGGVTITKSITLNGDGTLAGILAAGVNAIIINAGVNDVVVIRSLSINGTFGVSPGLSGVRILSARQVFVENCSIQGFNNFGVEGANTVNPLAMTVVNTSFIQTGVAIRQSSLATNSAAITNVRISRSTVGVDILAGSATVSNSTISTQTNSGIAAEGSSTVNVVNNSISNNATGVNALLSSTINLTHNSIFNNTNNGVLVAGAATCNRFQNNAIINNAPSNISGTCNPQTPS